MRRIRQRRSQGSIAAVAFIGMIPLIGAIGGFAVDCMHVNDEKGAVQRACDASAIAGAQDLWRYAAADPQMSATTCSGATQPPLAWALTVASMNGVDGDGLYTTAGRTVTATISKSVGTLPEPDTCTVDAQVGVRSLLFSLMHNNFATQIVNGHSVARTMIANKVVKNGTYPMAVGWTNLQPGGGPALSGVTAGSTFTWQFSTNAAWTAGPTSNASDVSAAQTAYGRPHSGNPPAPFNPGAQDGVPAQAVGDALDASNGVMASCAANIESLPAGTYLLAAVVDDASTQGSKTIKGFVVIEYQSYTGTGAGETFTGKVLGNVIVPVATSGGVPSTITTFGIKMARLVE